MKPQSTIDFRAIMSKPLNVSGVQKIKMLTPETIQALVRNYHPASQCAEQRKPAFVK